MDQPAGLQVDYIFRGVEHAVRVVVSGQVLELEVEDQVTADQWRGEFDANCECVLGWAPSLPSSSRWEGVWVPSLWPEAELENLSTLPLGWASGRTSGGTFLSTQSLKT